MVCHAAPEAAATTLRYAVEEGLRYQFEMQQATTSTLTVSSGGSRVPVQQTGFSRLAGDAQVLEVVGGKPAALSVRIDSASAQRQTVNGAPSSEPFPLAGQSVVVRIVGDAIASVTQASGAEITLGPETLSALRPFVVFDDGLLPDRNVAVGDAWATTIADEPAGQSTDLELTLASLDRNGSLELATVDTRGTVSADTPGSTMRGDVSGLMIVDVATGLPVAAYGKGQVTINSEQVQNGQTMTVHGTGDIEVKRVIAYGDVPRASADLEMPSAPASAAVSPDRGNASGDRRLVGMFKGESVYSGATYSNTQLFWLFDGAGGVYYGAQTHWSASARDYNQDLVWSAGGASAGSGDRGRWETADGVLTIRWENGNVSRYAYGFEPNGALVFRHPGTRKLINFYARVR